MREILFRGKRVDDGEWVEGCLVASNLIVPEYPNDVSNALGYYYNEVPFVGFVEVTPTTVGQYTGLIDKKGKKIFEGDILRSNVYPFSSDTEKDNYYALIEWFDESYAFGVMTCKRPNSPVKGISDGNCEYLTEYDMEDFEIIGNIHDNPELVEVN